MSADASGRARAADDRSRLVARTEFARPLVLDAGAGTGKTTVVGSRIVAWLLGPGWERAAAALAAEPGGSDADRIARRAAERVVAITFTDRAAADMAERIATMLAEVHQGKEPKGLPLADLPGPDEVRRARAAALLAAHDRLAVSTIHAFCRRLLAAWPLEARLHPAFEVDAEGTLLAGVVEEVMVSHLPRALGSDGDPDWIALAALGHGPGAIAAALGELAAAAVPPEALDDEPLADARARAVAEELGGLASRVIEVARGPFASQAASRLTAGPELLDALGRIADAAPQVTTAAGLLALADDGLEKKQLDRLAAWREIDPARRKDGETAVLAPVAAELEPAAEELHALLTALDGVDPEVLEPARRVLRPLLAEVAEELRRRGIATFSALVRDAAGLLARDEIAAALRRGIDQLVVDEFQDTDPLQCAIVRRLALDREPGPPPGLMLVGDPKQSIYGWRDASLAAYRAFVREVLQAGGESLPLVVNFRSLPAVLDEVTRIARPLLVEDGDRQAAFQELVPFRRPDEGSGGPAVEYWVSWSGDALRGGRETSAGEAREIEARAVAEEIAALRAGPDPPRLGQMAILFRATTQLETYLAALRERDIPFAVEREREYFRRREIIDLGALVRAIADPLDTLALVTYLRSPWGGVPDAALPGLWHFGLAAELAQLDRPDEAALRTIDAAIDAAARELPRAGIPGLGRIDAWPQAAKGALRTLLALRRTLAEQPADGFVEALRALVLAEEFAAARFLGPHRLANVERFLRRLLATISGPDGVQGVLRELRLGVAERREEREGAPGDESLDAVRVLTIHKAKGLEFERVWVVDMHHAAGRGTRRENRAVRGPGGGWDLLLLKSPGLGFHRVQVEEARVGDAEASRALYVAATRARERIVFAGAWPLAGLPGGGRRARSRTQLGLLAAREGGVPLDGLTAPGAARTDADGVVWRIPHAPDAADARQPPGAGTGAPVEGAERELAQLHAARGAAALRAARLATATPSGAAHAVERARRDGEEEPDDPSLAAVRSSAPRDVRLAVGSAIHRALEAWELEAEAEPERARQRARLVEYLPSELEPALRVPALAEAEAFLDRMAANGALRSFTGLRGRVLGREVPLLAAPAGADADAFAGEEEPLGAWVGTIDLLYRAADGALVVADYKTDALPDPGAADFPAALAAAVERYRPQLARYVESLRAIFPDPPPRAELWFLAAGRVERA